MYDCYISLGDNCEIGLQFRRIGHERSSLFRFMASSFDATYELIDNDFEGLFLKKNLVPRTWGENQTKMVLDTRYGVGIYASLPCSEDAWERKVFEESADFDAAYEREYGKVKYLSNKWRSLTASNQKVLYVIKSPNNSRDNAEKLLALFKEKYPRHDFDILYLQLSEFSEPDWGLTRLRNRYMPKFAPYRAASKGDIESWDRLFLEFPLLAEDSQRQFNIRQIARDYLCRPQKLRPSSQLIRQWDLDVPKAGRLENLILRGWVVGQQLPVNAVELVGEAEKKVIKAIAVDQHRPAVAKGLSGITNAATAGFSAEISNALSALEYRPRSYSVMLQAVLADDKRVPLAILEFKKARVKQ